MKVFERTRTPVLVYGSLMRNLHNHHLLEQSAQLTHDHALTRNQYALVHAPRERRPYPYALEPTHARPNVDSVAHLKGELYEVDQSTLDALDRLEEHPVWYRRTRVPLARPVDTWAYRYLLVEPNAPAQIAAATRGQVFAPVQDGDWMAYAASL